MLTPTHDAGLPPTISDEERKSTMTQGTRALLIVCLTLFGVVEVAASPSEMALIVKDRSGRALEGVYIGIASPGGSIDRSDGDGKAWAVLPIGRKPGEPVTLLVRFVEGDPWIIVSPKGGRTIVPTTGHFVEVVLVRQSELNGGSKEEQQKSLNKPLDFADFKRGDLIGALARGSFYELEEDRFGVIVYLAAMNNFLLDDAVQYDRDGTCPRLANASMVADAQRSIAKLKGLGTPENPDPMGGLALIGKLLLEMRENPLALIEMETGIEVMKAQGRQDGQILASTYGCANLQAMAFYEAAKAFVRDDVAPRDSASGEDACHRLVPSCLANLAVREMATAAAQGEGYRLRHVVSDLAYLLRREGLDASVIVPSLEGLDPTYRVEALADVHYFGGVESLKERIEAELRALSEKSEWSFHNAVGAVAAVAAASGHRDEAMDWITTLGDAPQRAPALMHLAFHAAKDGATEVAVRTAKDALTASGKSVEFESLRRYFSMIEILAAGPAKSQAFELAEQLADERHRIVALAHAARGANDKALLGVAIQRAKALNKHKNYPLEEIAILAGELGDGNLALEAASALDPSYSRDSSVIAMAAAAVAKRDVDLVRRADTHIRQIPRQASLARADAKAAVAVALMELGQQGEAWNTSARLEPRYYRVELLVRLAGISTRRY